MRQAAATSGGEQKVAQMLRRVCDWVAVVRHSAHAQIMRFEMNGSFCFCLLNNLKTVEIKQIQYAVLTQTDVFNGVWD